MLQDENERLRKEHALLKEKFKRFCVNTEGFKKNYAQLKAECKALKKENAEFKRWKSQSKILAKKVAEQAVTTFFNTMPMEGNNFSPPTHIVCKHD
jgi:hypothetical protein